MKSEEQKVKEFFEKFEQERKQMKAELHKSYERKWATYLQKQKELSNNQPSALCQKKLSKNEYHQICYQIDTHTTDKSNIKCAHSNCIANVCPHAHPEEAFPRESFSLSNNQKVTKNEIRSTIC